MPSEPAWFELLESTKISDIIPKDRKVVKAQYSEEVSTLLKKMSDAQILSIPVVDEDPKIGVLGFVDVLDLLFFVLDVTEENATDITKLSTVDVKWEGKCFERQQSGYIVNRSQADPMYTIHKDLSLLNAVKLFADGIHRLAVIDNTTPNHYISNIISQSDIVNFLSTRGVWVGSQLEKSLDEARISQLGVATVLDNVTTVDALRYMRDLKTTGVGIVDKSRRLVANLSASDLLGLTEDKFMLLGLPVRDFLNRMHGYTKPPVYCKSSDSVESLLMKFVVHKVHRVYVVDDSMIPTGVVTMTDIMQFLLINR